MIRARKFTCSAEMMIMIVQCVILYSQNRCRYNRYNRYMQIHVDTVDIIDIIDTIDDMYIQFLWLVYSRIRLWSKQDTA